MILKGEECSKYRIDDRTGWTYPNEAIVSFEADTYGVLAPGHGLRNIWCSKVPLMDKRRNIDDTNYKQGWNCSESQIWLHLQLVELSILPVVQLELLLHCDTHPQDLLSWAGLLQTKETKLTNQDFIDLILKRWMQQPQPSRNWPAGHMRRVLLLWLWTPQWSAERSGGRGHGCCSLQELRWIKDEGCAYL